MRFFVLLLFLLSQLSAIEYTPPSPNAARVNVGVSLHPCFPKVNPVNGEYIEEECDLVVAGCQPLSARRFYRHLSIYSNVYAGWDLNPESSIKANFEKDGLPQNVAIGDPGGGIVLLNDRHESGYSFDASKQPSFTNTALGDLSGQSHPKNFRLSYYKNHDKEPARFEFKGDIVDGSGRHLNFQTKMHKWHKTTKEGIKPENWIPYACHIDKEILPNGNFLKYDYHDAYFSDEIHPTYYRLKSITAFSKGGTNLGSLEFVYPEEDKNITRGITVKGSDGRFTENFVDYCVTDLFKAHIPHRKPKSIKNGYLYISKSCSSTHPKVIYRYDTERRIDQTERPDGRLFKTVYKDWKVAEQQASIGPNGELRTIAKFEYFDNFTHLYDGENNLTCFFYDHKKRLVATEKYQGKEICRVEKNEWYDSGELKSQSVEDGSKHVLKKVEYKYDPRGNVETETHSGQNGESYTIFRTYSDDGFNLKLSESDDSGKEIRYVYLPGTNLCVREFVYVGNKISKRTFHEYDDCAICIKSVVDNGSGKEVGDLSGVTYRRITEVTPRRVLPCYGLPEVVEEKTIDKNGKEILLSKRVYHYTPSGSVCQEDVYDSNGQFCFSNKKEYHKKNELVAVSTNAIGEKAYYDYDDNFNLTKIEDKDATLKTIKYDKGNRPYFIEEKVDKTNRTTLTHSYNLCGQIKETIDENGFHTLFEHDCLGRVKKIIHPDGGVEIFVYDALGNVLEAKDPKGYVTIKTYDYRGNVLSMHASDGSEELFTYDAFGLLKTHTDRNGAKTIYSYDPFNHLTKTEIYSAAGVLLKEKSSVWNAFLQLASTDEEGVVTKYCYDYAGRKIEEKTCDRVVEFKYDNLGRLFKTIRGDIIDIVEYDFLNRPIENRRENAAGTIVRQEKYAYDSKGNKTHSITSAGETITRFNGKNLPYLHKNALGEEITFSYEFQGGFTKHKFDPNGIETVSKHDCCGRAVDLMTKNKSGEILQRIEKKYDLNGNQIEEIEHVFVGTTPSKTVVHTWEYGPNNRLEWRLEAGKKKTSYTYDQKGRLETIVKPDGQILHHAYDALGRLSEFYSSDFHYIYDYDKKDRVIEVKDTLGNTITTKRYDIYGGIEEERSNEFVMRYENDFWGQRLKSILPDGSEIIYKYACGDLTSVERGGCLYTYSKRNLEGNPTEIDLPANLGKIQIDRDALQRWKKISSPYFTEIFPEDAYDKVGNLLHYHTVDVLGSVEENYKYDQLNQLTEEKAHRYAYDSLYNRIEVDEHAYVVNDLCQVSSDGERAYSYDANGNLKSDGVHTFEYDSQDRLIEVKKGNEKTTYTYDAFHRRLSKTMCDAKGCEGKVFYLWDGNNEIGAIDSYYKEILELRVLGQGLGAEIGSGVLFEMDGRLYVPLYDHRGCVVALLDGHGNSVESYRYTAFGEQVEGGALSPWRFASKRVDGETGFIFFGRRYYAPKLGRWITPDPMGFADGPNLYAYVHNHPLSSIDLYGLWNNPFAGTRNILGFFNRARQLAFQGVQLAGMHLIPIAGIRDLVESVGRWGSGRGNFWELCEYRKNQNQLVHIDGRKVAHRSMVAMNGMNMVKDEARQYGQNVSKKYGGVEVDVIYNGSQGFLTDLLACGVAKLGLWTPVEKIAAHYVNTKLQDDPAHRFNWIAHSQGASHLMNAGSMLKPWQRHRIDVEAFGPATIIPRGFFSSARNYVSRGDIIPWLGLGILGKGHDVTFLPASSYNPLKEHSFSGETYQNILRKLGREFQKDHLEE